MNITQFAQQIVDDPLYRSTLTDRAHAGTLPMEIELLLLETAADLRPLAPAHRAASGVQSPTLALIRPTVFDEVKP